MRQSTGNMYGKVSHTHNEISGSCWHDCGYCYMKAIMGIQFRPLTFNESANNENLGQGNYIFVGSSTDMWAENVPSDWILRVLDHCLQFNGNRYLLQSKNPRWTSCKSSFVLIPST